MKRPTEAERHRRILEFWLERPKDRRTEADVLQFYYWLSQRETELVPDGAGAYQQLQTIVRQHIVAQP